MYELISEIISYMDYLREECGLSVTVHFEKNLFAKIPERVAGMLLSYNTHNNPYCIMVKAIDGEHRKCVYCQSRIIKKCANNEKFLGICHAGVYEYIHAIHTKDKIAGFVSVSGYRKGSKPPKGIYAQLWRTCLLEEEIPEKVCDSLIPPLCRMIELFFNYMPEGVIEGNEYNLMLRFVNEHHNKLELSDLCRAFHRSPSYISHMFKNKSGMTLKSYCNLLKNEDAKKLLSATDLPITEVAYAAGFGDVSYFIHIFKKITGETPLKWRKLNK